MANARGYIRGIDEMPTAEKEAFQAILIQLGGTVTGSKGRGYLHYLPMGGGTPGQAFNLGRVQERAGTPVWVDFFQNQPVIMHVDSSRMDPNGAQGYRSPLLAQHAPDHGWGSGDPLYVDSRQIKELMVRPAGEFKVNISPGRYGNGLGYAYFAGQQNYDLAAYQPAVAGTKRKIGLYLDSAGAVQAVEGGLLAVTAVIPELAWPDGVFRLISFILFESEDFIDFEYVKQEKALWVNPVVKATALYTPAGTLAWSVNSAGDLDNTLGGVMTAPATEVIVKVRNASGATVAAGDVGYIDEAAQYKRTTTASDTRTAAVVVVGGATATDIYVGIRGRFPVSYVSTAPTSGQFLVFSTTGGAAQAQATININVLGVVPPGVTAAGGLVEALLLPNRFPVPRPDTHYLYGVDAASDSRFISTIATLPGGAALTYGAVTTGAANTIVPWVALDAAFNGKLVLHNTTRGTSALISAVVTGTSTITLTATVPAGWQVGDAITTESQTNTATVAATCKYFDLDFSGMTTRPLLGVAAIFHLGVTDSGGGTAFTMFHPFEANSASKSFQQWSVAASVRNLTTLTIPVIQARLCMGWNATGSGTFQTFCQHVGWIEAAP